MSWKRGHVPSVLLFGVALALFVGLLFVFMSFRGSFESQSRAFADVMSDAAFQQEYVFLVAERAGRESILSGTISKEGLAQAVAEREIRMEYSGNFFAKIRNSDFRVEEHDGVVVFEARGLFVQAQRGETRLVRRFDLLLEFDSAGAMTKKVCEEGRC